jgi:hypothetical protein
MATLWVIDSFEHGNLTNAANGVYSIATGGTPAIQTTIKRTGTRALQLTPSAAQEQVGYNPGSGVRQSVHSFYVYFDDLPGASCRLQNFNNANGKGYVGYNQSTNKFRISVGGSVWTDVGPTLSADTWYLIDVKFDCSADPAVITAKVDGGTEASTNRSQTASDLTAEMLGTDTSDTYTAYIDDWVISHTIGDYPIGTHSVEALIPSSDGTHNITTSGDFDSFTGTAFSNATTNGNTFIGHRPLQLANTADQVIRQDLGTTSNYMEFGLENLSAGTDTPVAVRAIGCYVESATSGASLGEMRLLLSDNTEVLTTGSLSMINSTEDPGTTVTTKKRMAIDPSGGWDRTKVDGLKIRLGFGDGAPDVNFIDAMVEVALLAAGSQSATPGLISQTGATFSPTIVPGQVTVSPALIDRSGAVFAPQFNLGISMGLIDRTGAVFATTVVPGSVTVVPGLINQAGVAIGPSIAQSGGEQSASPGLIDQTGATFTPTVVAGTVTVSPVLLGTAGQTISPSIAAAGSSPAESGGSVVWHRSRR